MTHDTIVIGAGLAGLVAAQILRRAGRDVLVLEKSRGLGGRAATRRWDGFPVDHGAQFFTARSVEFRRQVAEWTANGVSHEWTRGFHQHRRGTLTPPRGENFPRYVCREGMSSLGRALVAAGNLSVEREAKVVSVRVVDNQWHLSCEDGRNFEARALVVTAPPPQGAALLVGAAPDAAATLGAMAMDPCLALAVRFPRRTISWHGIQSDDPVISWIGNDSSKRPERHEGKTILVIHASPACSREHYTAGESDITATLLARASEISGEDLRWPEAAFLQRWRYAMPAEMSGHPAAIKFDAPAPLVLAGECFGGGKIEGAWLSGAAAGAMSEDQTISGCSTV